MDFIVLFLYALLHFEAICWSNAKCIYKNPYQKKNVADAHGVIKGYIVISEL